MNKKLLKASALILMVLALIMFYLSYRIGGLPPAVTGFGFLIIAVVFLNLRN